MDKEVTAYMFRNKKAEVTPCNDNKTNRNGVFMIAALFTMVCCFSISPFVLLPGHQQALAKAKACGTSISPCPPGSPQLGPLSCEGSGCLSKCNVGTTTTHKGSVTITTTTVGHNGECSTETSTLVGPPLPVHIPTNPISPPNFGPFPTGCIARDLPHGPDQIPCG